MQYAELISVNLRYKYKLNVYPYTKADVFLYMLGMYIDIHPVIQHTYISEENFVRICAYRFLPLTANQRRTHVYT